MKTLDLEGLFSSSSGNPESRRALEIMSKGWPWNREIYALILERLVGAGARVGAFDCLFPEPARATMPSAPPWNDSGLKRLSEGNFVSSRKRQSNFQNSFQLRPAYRNADP